MSVFKNSPGESENVNCLLLLSSLCSRQNICIYICGERFRLSDVAWRCSSQFIAFYSLARRLFGVVKIDQLKLIAPARTTRRGDFQQLSAHDSQELRARPGVSFLGGTRNLMVFFVGN